MIIVNDHSENYNGKRAASAGDAPPAYREGPLPARRITTTTTNANANTNTSTNTDTDTDTDTENNMTMMMKMDDDDG